MGWHSKNVKDLHMENKKIDTLKWNWGFYYKAM